MGWQTVVITKPCKLSIKDKNLLIKSEVGSETKVAIDEISSIVVEERQVTLTSPFLSMCAQKDIALFVCDEKHIPSGILLPFHTHSRFSKNSYLQINSSKPFQNRIWQNIIKRKIFNQSRVLERTASENILTLNNLSKKVQSGDKTNNEATAASIYWKSLFNDFFRGMPEIRSRGLDYGYAIVRGAIGRSISGGGFLPAFGVFHSNDLNPFNFADDLIEPFRPFIDLEVFTMYGREISSPMKYNLTKEDRVRLINILNKEILFNNEKTTLLNSIDEMVFSYSRALKSKDPNLILLPEFIDE
ncbi:MAG: type II CRISPR-associated endonuclease Cas1 [Campylobacterales bacterium]|nr:type II CRISPR-associated endonuclease Cas1 [Campylobacterales bacterium]